MSTYANFSIQTRTELQDWILAKLGYPLVTIELTSEQLDIAINDALEAYSEYSTESQNYIMVGLEDYIEGVGVSLSGYNVIGVFSLDEEYGRGGINTLFSIENQLANQGVMPYTHGGGQSFVTYELANQFMDMVRRYTASKFDFHLNVRTQMLKLWPDPVQQGLTGKMVLGVHTVPPEEDLLGERVVKYLALAASKMMLGTVRKKFDGVQLPGGGTIDTSIGDEGSEEWDKWIDKLIDVLGPHGKFYIG